MYKCYRCGKELKNKAGLVNHEKFCDGTGTNLDKKKRHKVWICPLCGYSIKRNREKHLNYCEGKGPRRTRPKDYTRGGGRNKGRTNVEIYGEVKAKEISRKLSLSSLRCNSSLRMTEKTRLAWKKKLSDAIKRRYADGWMPKAGRCKKIKYSSFIAGEISVDGSWELLVAKYLDKLGVMWNRNTKRFPYFKEDSFEVSYYTPDFYVEDWDSYIEVKGYETELDRTKWKQFWYKLLVWKKDKIKEIKMELRSSARAD